MDRNKHPRYVTAEEAVAVVRSGDHLHFSSVATSPQCLIEALCARGRRGELHNVVIHHLHTEGPAPYVEPEFEGVFQHDGFFIGANVRKGVNSGYADYIPVFLGEIPTLYRQGVIPCDVAMIQVSLPNDDGMVSMGSSVDATLAAIERARTVVAVVNAKMPFTYGDSVIPLSAIDLVVRDDRPLPIVSMAAPTEQDRAIGRYCAELIDDGACLQMGIGSLPNAVLACLTNHKNLGIQTEMFSDGILPLVEQGVITGSNKALDKGKIVSTFVMGSQRVYDFLDHNPQVLMKEVSYTNDPFVIARQPRMVAINSGLQIDLTGQVCADSIGTRIYSGVGGQIDFVYGASRSHEGKSIIAMPSMTLKGISKVVPTLTEGAGVVTTRAHVHWFVTEYGAVNLFGQSCSNGPVSSSPWRIRQCANNLTGPLSNASGLIFTSWVEC